MRQPAYSVILSKSCGKVADMQNADIIRTHRQRAGLSQAALADQLKVNKSAVAQWELGTTTPTAENMAALKLILGISADLVIPEGRPYAGEVVEDPGEIALLRFWRGLSEAKRHAVVDLLAIGAKTDRKSA